MAGDGRASEDATTEAQLRSIHRAVGGANIGVCVAVIAAGSDGDARIVFVNEAGAALLGGPGRAQVGGPPPAFMMSAEGGREMPADGVLLHADGREIPMSYVLTDADSVDVPGERTRVGFFWDISERRAVEEALRSEEDRLRRLIAAAPDGIVVSRNGVILDANAAAAQMLGFEHVGELLGTSLHTLMSPVDTKAMIARVAAAQDGTRLAPRAYEARRRDGRRVCAEVTSVPYEHEGKPAILGFARDVTERLRLETQLVQNERLAALGTLAAGVAHEINNPLTVTSLGIDAIERLIRLRASRPPHEDDPNELLGLLADLRGGIARVAGIVRDLRSFARANDEVPGPTDVLAALAASERIASHALRHRARVSSHYGTVPLVNGHLHRLEQVFVNLLLNAAQAMPEGHADCAIAVRVYVAADGRVAVEIADNGPGIPPDVLTHVFDPFFSTKPVGEGTGLGLAISHGIVTRLGGEIVLESEVGVGTVARVLLQPCSADASLEKIAGPTTQERAALPRSRVLVIDDEVAITAAIRTLLGDDHHVTTVNGGDAGCNILLQGPSFDVVFCDIMMPVVSGMDVYARVSAARPDLLPRMVFMTGGASTPRAAEFLATIPNAILDKPFVVKDIERIIAEVRAHARAHGSVEMPHAMD